MTLHSIPFPALTGDVVTEAHARKCREDGHATHTIDGQDAGICPRCGDTYEQTGPTMREIMDEARNVTNADVIATFPALAGKPYTEHHLGKWRREVARRRLATR